LTEETAQGRIRLQETRNQSAFHVLSEYKAVLAELLHTPRTLYTAGIMLVLSISALVSGSFWAIIVTEKLHIPASRIAIFPFVKSAVMIAFFIVVMPRLNKLHFKVPMVVGFFGFVASQVVLVTSPEHGYASLILSVFLEACSFAAVSPLVDRMTVLTIRPEERARILSIVSVGIILLTSPFGWIAGTLSGIDKNLPFILNMLLFGAGAALAWVAGSHKRSPAEQAGG